MRNPRYALLSLAVVVAVFSCSGLQYLSVTPDNRVLLSPKDPRVQDLLAIEDTFEAQNIVAFVVSCDEGDPSCTSELPSLVRATTELAYNLPAVVRVDSLATRPLLESTDDTITVNNYLDSFCTPSCPSNLYTNIPRPESVKHLVNQNGTSFGIYARLNFDVQSTTAVQNIYAEAQLIIQQLAPPDGASIRFVGRVPLMHAFVEATNSELTSYMGIAIILIFSLLWATLGSLSLAFVVIGLSILTILSTLGLAGWFGLVISTASAALPTIILTLTTATSMHYFMHVVRVMSEDPTRDQRSVAFGAVSQQLNPTLITAATTSLAMLSMLTVDSPPFQDVGLWTAVSLVFACFYLFVVVPNLIAKMPKLKASKWQGAIQPLLNQHARYVGRHKTLAAIGLGVTIISASAIFQLEIDDDFVRYFGEDTTFRQNTEFVSERLIGPTNIEVVVDSGNIGGIHDPEYLNHVDQLVTRIRKREEIDSATSIIDILEPAALAFADNATWREASPELIAQLLLTYELSLEPGQSTKELVDFDNQKTRISVVAKDITSAQIANLESDLYKLTNDNNHGYEAVVTGEAIPLAHLSAINIPLVAASLIMTLLIVSLVLAFYFKSMRISWILFTSTTIPVVLGFGIWSVFAGSVGLAATVILSVCMGVVIDDSIHLLYRFKDGLERLQLQSTEAAAYAVHRVGSAIITTTVILSVGFGVLAFSSFEVNRTFGICTVLILVAALVIDLLILPSLLPSGSYDKKQQFE